MIRANAMNCAVIGSVILIVGVAAYGDEIATPERDQTSPLNSLQASIFQGLSTLRSGEFIGTWTERFDSPIEGEGFDYSGEIRGKYDDAIGCYAIQRPVWIATSNKSTSPSQVSAYGVIQTPEVISRYGETSSVVTICSVDEHPGKGPRPTGGYFDPRAVGVLWWRDIFRGAIVNQDEMSKAFRGKPTKITEVAVGRKLYEWESSHILKSLIVENSNVEGVVRQVKLTRLERYPDVDDNMWSPPLEVQDVSWKSNNEVFVPSELLLEVVKEVVGESPPKTRDDRRFGKRTVEVKLEWSRVNDSFETTEFTSGWFHVKQGTVVSDLRNPVDPITH